MTPHPDGYFDGLVYRRKEWYPDWNFNVSANEAIVFPPGTKNKNVKHTSFKLMTCKLYFSRRNHYCLMRHVARRSECWRRMHFQFRKEISKLFHNYSAISNPLSCLVRHHASIHGTKSNEILESVLAASTHGLGFATLFFVWVVKYKYVST